MSIENADVQHWVRPDDFLPHASNGNNSSQCAKTGVVQYDRDELVSYFLALEPPEELLNHKQVYSIQPLPPETLSNQEPLNDVNSTAVLSYQRAQRENRDSGASRRRRNRTSVRLEDEGAEDDGWASASKERKSIVGLPPPAGKKSNDSPQRKLTGDFGSSPPAAESGGLFDDLSQPFFFEDEDDEVADRSFIARGGFFGKSLPSSKADPFSRDGDLNFSSHFSNSVRATGLSASSQAAATQAGFSRLLHFSTVTTLEEPTPQVDRSSSLLLDRVPPNRPPPPACPPPPPPWEQLDESRSRAASSSKLFVDLRTSSAEWIDSAAYEHPLVPKPMAPPAANPVVPIQLMTEFQPQPRPHIPLKQQHTYQQHAPAPLGGLPAALAMGGSPVSARKEIGSFDSPAARTAVDNTRFLPGPAPVPATAMSTFARAPLNQRVAAPMTLAAALEVVSPVVKSPPPPRILPKFGAPTVDVRQRCWRYRDPHGVVQGPFSTMEMQHWSDLGYFSSHLPLQYSGMGPFLPLKALFPKGVPPFRVVPCEITPELIDEFLREEKEKQKEQADKEAMHAAQAARAAQAHQQLVAQHGQQYAAASAQLAARQQQAAQMAAAQQVAAAHHAHHAHDAPNVGAYHGFGHGPGQPEDLGANRMHRDDRGKRGGEKPERAANKRERRKKEKEEKKDVPPPAPIKPMILNPQEFPSLGAPTTTGASPKVEPPPAVTYVEPEGFWERPSRPVEQVLLAPLPAEPKDEKPKVRISKDEKPKVTPKVATPPEFVDDKNDKSKQLPRRKRGKGVAADPKMLGFVAPHRGAIDHGD
eukprot:GEMP01011080.1.p1 GENE.GEMP01011080.1~~GEMP01011080.1.p1  ORF type:complete len:812 (+),score=232.36 GEMP01011080.1:56-2491(+)